MDQSKNKTVVYTNVLKRFFSDSTIQYVQVFLIIYDKYILFKQENLFSNEKINIVSFNKEYISKCLNSSYGYFDENDQDSLYLENIDIVKYQKKGEKLVLKLLHEKLLCVVERDENDNILFTEEKFTEENDFNIELSDLYYFFKDNLIKVEVDNISLPISFFTDYDRKSNLVSDIIEISHQTLSFEEIFNQLSRLFYYSFEVIVNLVDCKELCNSLQLDNSFFKYLQKSGIIIIMPNGNEIYLTNKGIYYLSKYININKLN